MNIIVIGSGIGGLNAAIRLQAQGHQVTIVEKQDKPGGRAYVYQQDGFTFDGGPTIITCPQLIDELFKIAGKQTVDYLKLVPLDPFYNIRFPDGSVFHYTNNIDYLHQQINQFNPVDLEGYYRLKKAADDIFKAAFPMMEQSFNRFIDLVNFTPSLIRLKSYESMTQFVSKYIKDERLRQVFSFHPLFIGGDPFKSSSMYATIHKLEQEFGIWYAMGGMGALINAFVKLFQELGGKLLLNTSVSQIAIDEQTRRATGVHLANREFLSADIVVSNADVAFTYMNLIPAKFRRKWTDSRIKKMNYSMSVFVLYFGTNRQYKNIAHHELMMCDRYRGLMQDIFKNKRLAEDFSLYVYHPTITDPSLAPPGCDSWYILSPVPNLSSGTDWKTVAKSYRDAIIGYLEEKHLPDLSKHIVTERYIDPFHFQGTLNSYLGNAFAIEPTLFQSAWFRPHSRSEDILNLYIVGAGTHPGAGLPGVMSSGKIVARLIAEEM